MSESSLWVPTPTTGDYRHTHPYTRPLDRRELEYMGADEDTLVYEWVRTWAWARVEVERNDFEPTESAVVQIINRTLNTLQIHWQPVITRLVQNVGTNELNKPTFYPVARARNPFRPGTPAYNHWQRNNALPEVPVRPVEAQPKKRRPESPTIKLGNMARHLTTNLIQDIGDKQKTLARRILVKAAKNKLAPKQVAVELGNALGLNDRWARAVENLHAKLLADGMSEKMAAHRSNVYAQKLIRKRGVMVARTELTRAQNAAIYAAWQQKQDEGLLEGYVVEKWLQPMKGACPECWAAADPDASGGPKVVKGLDEKFETAEGATVDYPPLHPHCFPAGTIVSGPIPDAGITRKWHGELVEVTFESGQQLTGTPNHPVLTQHGWVALGQLVEGGDVLRYLPGEREVLGHEDDYQMPACIEEVTRALIMSGSVTATTVPVSPEHFHGDGAGSEIAIIGTHRQLGHDGHSEVIEPDSQEIFRGTNVRKRALSAGSNPREVLGSVLPPASSRMGGGSISGSFLRSPGGSHYESGLVGSTSRHPGTQKKPTDGSPADAELVRQLVLARAGKIALDQVVGIRRLPAGDHEIHTISTPQGWYTANGVIVANCRCVVMYRVVWE